jgi:hypothetical protein
MGSSASYAAALSAAFLLIVLAAGNKLRTTEHGTGIISQFGLEATCFCENDFK